MAPTGVPCQEAQRGLCSAAKSWTLLFLVASCCGGNAATTQPWPRTPLEHVTALCAALEANQPAVSQCEIRIAQEFQNPAVPDVCLLSHVTVHRADPQRAIVSSTMVTDPLGNPRRPPEPPALLRQVYSGSEFIVLGGYGAEPPAPIRLRRVATAFPAEVFWQDAYGGFLDGGWEAGPAAFLPDVLAGAVLAVQPNRQRIGDLECAVVDAMVPGGTLRCWLAPDRDWLYARVELQQGRLPDRRDEAGVPFAALEKTIDQVEFERIEGHWAIVGARALDRFTRADGSRITYTTSARRTLALARPPESAFNLADVADGTPVSYAGEHSGARFEVRGGRVVPVVDSAAIDALRGDLRAQGPTPVATGAHTRAWGATAATVIGVALAAAGIAMWRKQRARSRTHE